MDVKLDERSYSDMPHLDWISWERSDELTVVGDDVIDWETVAVVGAVVVIGTALLVGLAVGDELPLDKEEGAGVLALVGVVMEKLKEPFNKI